MADDVGTVEVDVVSNFAGFAAKLKAQLARIASRLNINVPVNPDTARASILMSAWRKLQERASSRSGSSIGSLFSGGFASAIGRGLRAAGRAVKGAVNKMTSTMESGAKRMTEAFKPVLESYKSITKLSFGKLAIAGIIAIIPLVTSSIGALSGSLLSIVGSAAQASYASFALVGILGTLFQVTKVAGIVTNGLSAALKGEEGAMKKLAPSAQALVKSMKALSPEWTAMKKSIQGIALGNASDLMDKMGKMLLPILRTQLEGTAKIMYALTRSFESWVTSASFIDKFRTALSKNNDIFRQLKRAAVPLLRGMLNLYIALQPAALKLATKIKEVAYSFRQWSAGEGLGKRLMGMFERGWMAATKLWKITRNLGATLKNVFGAAVGPGDSLLKTFKKLSRELKTFTGKQDTKNSITDFAERANKASGIIFRTLGKLGKMIAPLFDPSILLRFVEIIKKMEPQVQAALDVIIPFVQNISGQVVTLFEKVQPTLSSLFDKVIPVMQTVFDSILAFVTPVFTKIGDAIKENGPKFEKFFAVIGPLVTSLAPVFKGLGSILGELIGQTFGFLGSVASFLAPIIGWLTPIIAKIAGFVGGVMTKFAPIIATVILAFVNWGSVAGKVIVGIVKYIPFIGRFLAPLLRLAGWLISKIGPAFKFLGRVVGAVFKSIFAIVGKVMGFIGPLVIRIFGAMGRVVANISGKIGAVIKFVFNGIKTVVTKVIPAVYNTVKNGITRVLDFVQKIPNKILNFAGAFLSSGTKLGEKVMNGIKSGLSAAGGFISDLADKIKNTINSVLRLPITLGKGPLKFTIPAFATGTNYAPGGMSLVGERGPELVDIPRGSRVKTAVETKRIFEDRAPESGGNTYIGTIMPHNYSEFERQVRERKRAAALGGRRTA